MVRIVIEKTYQVLSEIQHEGLREEAQGWAADKHTITAGRGRLSVNDGSGPFEGFVDESQGKGMVAWGDDMSDWIEANSIRDLFSKYTENME